MVNQPRVFLLFIFPEYDSEHFMSYTSDQLDEAKQDAKNFAEMYPGVLYISVAFIHSDGREEETFRWNNPLSAKLQALVNNVGDALSPFPMSLASAQPVGSFFQRLRKKYSNSVLALRPPSAEAFVSPLPSTLKTYGGRKSPRNTRQGLRR